MVGAEALLGLVSLYVKMIPHKETGFSGKPEEFPKYSSRSSSEMRRKLSPRATLFVGLISFVSFCTSGNLALY